MKVLMSAYACEPNRGSEPGVGWNWALQASRHHEVWVVTRSNNRDVIERELAQNPNSNLHFIYHDLPRWARWWKRGSRGVNLYYYLWQLTAVPRVREAHSQLGFDLGHHVTFVSFRHPSVLAWLDVPYVWGPVAGGEEAPRSFYATYGVSGAIQQAMRGVSNRLVRLDPFVRRTVSRASLIIAATQDTARLLPNAKVVPAIGMDSASIPQRSDVNDSNQLKLFYVGNLLYLKGLQLALRAVARAHARGASCIFTIVGDGQYRPELERLVSELGIEKLVEFRGNLPHDEVLALYSSHDVFLFPSLRDSGGFAVLEAMSAGLPIICLNLGGPGLAVTENVGIPVSPTTPKQVVEDLGDAIIQLANDPEIRRRMGRAGNERVQKFYDWEQKATVIDAVYSEVQRGSD